MGWSWCSEIGADPTEKAFYLKTEAESSLRNVVLNKNWKTDNANNNRINIPSLRSSKLSINLVNKQNKGRSDEKTTKNLAITISCELFLNVQRRI
jgi:hypothetical protein